MRNLIIVFICIIGSTAAMSQSYWLMPLQTDESTWCLTELINDEEQYCESEVLYQNYNPLLNLESKQLTTELSRTHGLNIYTIYKTEKDNLEQFIWGLSSKSKELQVLTDYRLANLASGKVMNFVDFIPGEIHINNFLDYEKGDDPLSLQLGGNALRKDLPLKSNTAQLAELIVFDKPLSPLGKSILESSLALKYSISLAPGTDYILTSDKQVVWEYDKNKGFHNNIAGIAKNESLYLNQKQSQSSIAKGFLAIGYGGIYETNELNQHAISDGRTMLWGDNEGVLEFLEGNEGIPVLQRKWLIENNGFVEKDKFEMILSEVLITEQLEDGYYLWMKLRQDGDSKLYSSENNSSFENVCFFDGSQKIEFIKAPKEWVDIDIDPSNCERELNGAMEMTVIGVDSPFTLKVTSNSTQDIVYDELVKGTTVHLLDLSAGIYDIKVIQNNKLIVNQQVNVTDDSLPELHIPTHYILDQKDNNVVDASYGMKADWEYEWTTPDGALVVSPRIEFESSGVYWVKVFNSTCFTFTKINVELINENIKSVVVYPNPSPNGLFHFELELESAFKVDMKVTDVTGRQILTKSYVPAIFIEDHIQLYGNGVYFITFTSGSSVRTKKLIVQIP